jgi:pyruvate formate lyase activating enzyme
MNKLNKTILAAVAITLLGFLPWLIIKKERQKVGELARHIASTASTPTATTSLREAMYYEKLSDGLVRCNLCPNRCVLAPGQIGICRARKNIDGRLYTLNYGQPVAVHIDPIEKKPLFHFLPGAKAYSLATAGCNLRCQYCQNWDISQVSPEALPVPRQTPAQIVDQATESGAQVIAFTYSEPIVFYEYMLDIAKLARQRGLKTVMISGGYINQEPLKNLLPYLDGVKIDLKAFSDEFYQKITNGHLQPVLDTIKTIHNNGTHLEIVYLLIPGENDSDEEITKMAQWLKENIGPDTILHFSRFYPQYKMTYKPPTPVATVRHARDLALRAGLKYVYTGNINYPAGETTYCPDGTAAIIRQGYFVVKNILTNGQCPDGTKIPGVWK